MSHMLLIRETYRFLPYTYGHRGAFRGLTTYLNFPPRLIYELSSYRSQNT